MGKAKNKAGIIILLGKDKKFYYNKRTKKKT